MDDLIKHLKSDHDSLRKLADNIFDFIVSDEKKIDFVIKFKEMILSHIEKEDKFLYPFLYKESEQNSFLKSKLDFFAKDWEETSKFALYYIEKYSAGKFDDDFTKDTAKLLSTLRQRMMKEEISLYSEYERRK